MFTVKGAVFNKNQRTKCYRFVTFRGVIVIGVAIFFSYNTFDGCFPSSHGKPQEIAID